MRVILQKSPFLNIGGKSVHMDGNKGDFNFVSHAHSDHAVYTGSNVLCSEETLLLLNRKRSTNLNRINEGVYGNFRFKLIDNGHILGSKALLVENGSRVLYTSDFNMRNRGFFRGFRAPKSDVLIMETTFGRPNYVFPDSNEVMSEAKDLIEDLLKKNKKVALIGYSLGKAQHLSKLAESFGEVHVDEDIRDINRIYSSCGFKIKDFGTITEKEESDIIISASAKKAGTRFRIGFSGWAVDEYYAYSRGMDKGFVLSDHADFFDLLKLAKRVSADKIFTTHGFAEEFAEFLNIEGFEAVPLKKNQETLHNFY